MLFCAVVLMSAFVGLGCRLAFLHLGEHDEKVEKVKTNRQLRRRLDVRRGRIYGRAGSRGLLALDVSCRDVCVDPMRVVQEDRVLEVAGFLSATLDVPTDLLALRLGNPRRRFAYAKRFVPTDLASAIVKRGLPGVFTENAAIRRYPREAMLCHVLGFVNLEGVGSAGIEQTMETYLRGTPGLVESEVDGLRHEVYGRRGRHIPALEGADVRLTIDENIQYLVECALDDALREHRPQGVWAIVQRVRTGEILAMAARPGYNPNDFRNSSPGQRLNRCIGYVYEPGSTFKALTMAAALDEGTVTPERVFDCEQGCWYYRGKPLRDYHGYGPLTVADGLKKSSNILAAKVALTLGDERFYDYLKAFGIGAPTGIKLPGEEGGILRPVSRWSNIAATRVAMGHGVAVTALQLLNVFCTIANDGMRMQPQIVDAVTGRDGSALYQRRPRVLSRPIRSDTAATMRRLLARVTEQGGTGRRARVAGYEVAGKTGTAEKIVDGHYSDKANIASFVGFLPAAAPEIGIVVVVDEPREKRTGGVAAAPYFRRIAQEAVRYLNVPPAERRIGDEAPPTLLATHPWG